MKYFAIFSCFIVFEFFFIKNIIKTLCPFDYKHFAYGFVGRDAAKQKEFLRCKKNSTICQNPQIVTII